MTQLIADVNEFTEETREAAPANFLMRIESLSLLAKHGINSYETKSFDAGGCKWKLIMNFEENQSKAEDDHVSVYVSVAESDSLPQGWEFNAIFTFFIHNQLLDYYNCFRGMARRFNAVNPKWGFSKLIFNKDLTDPSKGFVVDDICVFGAEVLVIKPQLRVNECLSLIKDTSLYKRDWKISNFSRLHDVWNSEEFRVGNQYLWKVTVYPKGLSWAKGRHMSVYVDCVDSKKFGSHKKVKAQVTMRIKSKLNDSDHSHKYCHWYTSSSPYMGHTEFIPIADLKSKGFLVDDCCSLEVEITVLALALDAPKN